MTPPNNQSPISQSQKEFFDDSSFKTLYGGVVVTWVSTSALAHVFGEAVDIKILGLTMAILVALVGYFLSEKRNLKKLVIAPFNGLLIYLTIIGGTSLAPVNLEDQQPAESDSTNKGGQYAFFRGWNPNNNIIETATELKAENQQLELKTRELTQINQVYEHKLDSTRQVIQTIEMSPAVRENLMRSLDVSRNPALLNNSLNQ